MATKKRTLSRQEKYQRMREKLEGVAVTSSGFWRPEVGRNIVRVLPEVGEMEFFWQQVGRHFMPQGGKRFYCPHFTSEGELDCPICEWVDELSRASDKMSKSLASQMRVRRSYWMNIIDRKFQDKGVQIFTPGIMIMGAIKSIVTDPDYGDVTDPEDGLDLVIKREGTGRDDTKYDVLARRHSSPLSDNGEEMEEWLAEAKDLSWVELSDDPEEDKDLSEGYTIFVLPYNRIVRESGLDSLEEDIEEDIEEDEDEEEEEESPRASAKAEVTRRRARRTRRR